MHIEIQRRNGKKYYYMVGTLRVGQKKWKKVRVYLGEDLKGTEIRELSMKKKMEFENKLTKTKKANDPLERLISTEDAKQLESAKSDYQKSIKKMDKFQYQNYYEKFLSEFTYDTNAIEGSTLTLSETAMILFEKVVPKGKSIREINEVQNHKDAFDFMLSHKKDITKHFVLHIHKLLLHNILWKYAGTFRDIQVYVRGADFMPAKPEDIEDEFKKLTIWYRRNKKKYHPVVVAAYFHHVFESIHPFRDGNGRIGRLILNFILRKNGFPMIDIKYRDRLEYYSALGNANKGDLKPLADLIIKCLKDSKSLM